MNKISDEKLLHEIQLRFTENKKVLNELQLLNEELKTANNKLLESESLKSHFIANIANEIRNPLASILLHANNIMSTDKGDRKAIIQMTSYIHSEVFYLNFQFNNIFTAAKLEAGQVSPEIYTVNIPNLLKSTIESFKYEAIKKKIDIIINKGMIYEGDINFKTDPEKLKLILSNLLSNAIKYSYKNGKIDITCDIIKDNLKFSVQDYGEGISEENQKIIFDRFKCADSGINSINRGHGLGLSVNKALLEILSGDIEVKTELNKGTTFTINLPEIFTEIAGTAGNDNEVIFDNCDDGYKI